MSKTIDKRALEMVNTGCNLLFQNDKKLINY